MSKFGSRPVFVYDLPLSEGVSILHPEQVVLKFGQHHSCDIGALCYLRRRVAQRRRNFCGKDVDLASFNSARADLVRDLIEYISEDFATGGMRQATMYSLVSDFLRFINWADVNEHTNVLNGAPAGCSGIRAYVTHLRERVAQNSLSNNSGASLQNNASTVLAGFLRIDVSDLVRGIHLLRSSNKATESTPTPCEDAQSKVLAMCDALFSGFSELVLEGKPYPFRLTMPKYLEFPHDALWVGVSEFLCVRRRETFPRCRRRPLSGRGRAARWESR